MSLVLNQLQTIPDDNETDWRGKALLVYFSPGLPMGGVASVCRPTIWAGPSPSRKSLNWLSGPRRVVGKTNLRESKQSNDGWILHMDGRTDDSLVLILTFRQSCLSWCCRRSSPCCPAVSLGSSSPRRCRSLCSVGWCCEASSSRRLKKKQRSQHLR